MPFLRDEAYDGVLCTFSTRTSVTAAGFARSSQLSRSRQGKRYGPSGRRHGRSTTTQISLGWVTLLQPARRASVLGHLSSLLPHCSGQTMCSLVFYEIMNQNYLLYLPILISQDETLSLPPHLHFFSVSDSI
jgi:hypothetical protein